MTAADTVEPVRLKSERQMSFQNTSSNAGEHKVRRARKRGSEAGSPRRPPPGAGRGWGATLLGPVLMLLGGGIPFTRDEGGGLGEPSSLWPKSCSICGVAGPVRDTQQARLPCFPFCDPG